MSPQTPSAGQALNNLAMFYELALDINSSLDLSENCEVFFGKYLARRNQSYCALYLRQDKLQLARDMLPASTPAEQPLPFRLFFCFPASAEQERPASLPPTLVHEIQATGIYCRHSDDMAAPHSEQVLPSRDKCVVSAFAVFDFGIVLNLSEPRQNLYEPAQLAQMRALFHKFARSVDACLEHAELIRESKKTIALEQSLAAAKQLESVGRLASGVAHDLNNFLGPLNLYPELMRMNLAEGRPIETQLAAVEKIVDDAGKLIADLMALAENAKGMPCEPVRLDEVVLACLEGPDAQALRANAQTLPIEFDSQPCLPVPGNIAALSKVLLNLLIHAYEFARTNGRILIRTGNTPAEAGAAANALIEFSYTSEPLEPSTLAQMFDPFFTTKSMGGHGSGLCLSVVHDIVTQMGGQARVTQGDTDVIFRLELPAENAAPGVTTSVAVAARSTPPAV